MITEALITAIIEIIRFLLTLLPQYNPWVAIEEFRVSHHLPNWLNWIAQGLVAGYAMTIAYAMAVFILSRIRGASR